MELKLTHTGYQSKLDASQDGIDVEVRDIKCFLELLLVDVYRNMIPMTLRSPLTGLHIAYLVEQSGKWSYVCVCVCVCISSSVDGRNFFERYTCMMVVKRGDWIQILVQLPACACDELTRDCHGFVASDQGKEARSAQPPRLTSLWGSTLSICVPRYLGT